MESCPSMLDVIKSGLESSGRATFRHRVLYVGEHSLGRNVEEHMKSIVSAQADQPKDDSLTGFLLAYQRYFIHFVEGSESTLTKHLRLLGSGDTDIQETIGKTKVIVEITHVSKRCFISWTSRFATPPTLAYKLKTGVAEVARHAELVLAKTLTLVDTLKKLPPGAPLSQQMALQVPEAELLESLLDTPLIKDVREILQEQRVPPSITLYDDVVWPMQSDFVPYNLLEDAIAVQSSLQEIRPEGAEDAEGTEGAEGAEGAEDADENRDEEEGSGSGEQPEQLTLTSDELDSGVAAEEINE